MGGNCSPASAARARNVGDLEKGHLAAMARSHPILPMIPMSGQVELPAWCLVAGVAAVCLVVALAVHLRRIRRRLAVTLESLVDQAIGAQPTAWEKYCAGEDKAAGALVGAVMKASSGQADGKAVTAILQARRG